jgi:hypothetical protein
MMALGSLTDQSPRVHRWNTFIAGLGIDADWRTADGRDEKRRDGRHTVPPRSFIWFSN